MKDQDFDFKVKQLIQSGMKAEEMTEIVIKEFGLSKDEAITKIRQIIANMFDIK